MNDLASCLLLLTSVTQLRLLTGQQLSLTVHPPSSTDSAAVKLLVGSQFSVTCSTTAPISNSSVLWYRVQDSIRYQIGVDEMLSRELLTDERYTLTGGDSALDETITRAYILTVHDAQPEDSADIECTLAPGGVSKKTNVAVCYDPSSAACDCMLRERWASPICFQGAEENIGSVSEEGAELRRATVGLSVSAAVLLLYSLVMCATLSRAASAAATRQHEDETHREPASKLEPIQELDDEDTKSSVDISNKLSTDGLTRRNIASNTRVGDGGGVGRVNGGFRADSEAAAAVSHQSVGIGNDLSGGVRGQGSTDNLSTSENRTESYRSTVAPPRPPTTLTDTMI